MTQDQLDHAFHSYSTSRGMGMTRSEAIEFLDEPSIPSSLIDSFEARVTERFTRKRDEATELYTTLIEGGAK